MLFFFISSVGGATFLQEIFRQFSNVAFFSQSVFDVRDSFLDNWQILKAKTKKKRRNRREIYGNNGLIIR